MAYKVTFLSGAQDDFDNLDGRVKKLTLKQVDKLEQSPELGEPLGNKAGNDLTGYRKLTYDKKDHRIVYRIDEERNEVEVWAIDNREDFEVYRSVAARIKKSEEQ